MRTLVLASAKGGVGKTTLATALAVEASKSSRVALIDLDPQQSASRFLELRGGDNPRLVTGVEGIAEALELVADDGFDLAIVDTAPASLSNLVAVLAAADLVVIPVRPSPLDVEASDVMIELAGRSGRPFVFVINGALPVSTLVTGTRSLLAEHGQVADTVVTHTDAHPVAMIRGQTAAEVDRSGVCRRELQALWQEIESKLKRPRRRRSSSAT